MSSNNNNKTSSVSSSTSFVDDDAFSDGFMPDFSLIDDPTNNGQQHHYLTDSTNATKHNSNNTKTCMPGGFFWRSKASRKVNCADVASVGGASDAMISVCSKMRMSGRDLHESAKVSLNAGEYKKALSMFESLLQAQIDRFGKIHASVGAALHNVAVVHLRMGNPDIAEPMFVEAVDIRKETLGCDQLETAASLSKLGSTQVALQKFDDALINLREAHRIACAKVGHHHKTVAQTLCNLAYLYFQAGELLAAEATFNDALDIYRSVWASDQDRDSCMAQLTDTLCNIGSIQNKRKRFTAAIPCFKEALDLQQGVLGHDHPRVIATWDNLGFSYSKNKDYASALKVSKNTILLLLLYCWLCDWFCAPLTTFVLIFLFLLLSSLSFIYYL